MAEHMLLSIIYLFKETIFHPTEVFRRIKQGEMKKEILIVFFTGSLIPLYKSFWIRTLKVSFFVDERINQLLSNLSNPQLNWLISYLIYFIFILGVFGICKLFNKKANLKILLIALMSISTIGILGQSLFYVLKFIVQKKLIFFASYLPFFWSIILSVQAIKVTQQLSLPKTLVSFLIPALIVVFMGFTVITPFLAWLII